MPGAPGATQIALEQRTAMHRETMRCEHSSNRQMRRMPSEPSANKTPPLPLRGARVLHKGGGCARAPGGARHGGGNRAVTSQPRTGQPTSCGDVKSAYGGGRRVGQEWVRKKGHPGAPTDGGRSNTDTQDGEATPGGTRASTADKEEGRGKAGEATRTGNQNGGDGGAFAWEAATTKGMAWPASPVATGCQGNPCSTGIRGGRGVSRSPDGLFAQQEREDTRGRPAVRGKGTYGGRSGQPWRSRARGPHTHGNTARQAMDGLSTEVRGQQKQSNDPGNNQHNLNTPTTGRH